MWPYWVLFAVPALAAMEDRSRAASYAAYSDAGFASSGPSGALPAERWTVGWWLAALAVLVFVGFRFETGGDWFNYQSNFEAKRGLPLGEMMALGDPGYRFFEWLANERDWGFVGVNALGALLFTAGLAVFCRSLPRPWLALAVAVPYVVVVVGMGYSRQAIALGLAMLGLTAFRRGSTLAFVVWVVLGATFHRSAVVLIPIAALASTRNRWWTATWVGVTALASYSTLLESSVEQYMSGYIDDGMQSEGAQVRLVMNALPAVLLLRYRGRFDFVGSEQRMWRLLAVIALLLLALLPVVPSSTALDRIGLYLLPLQMVVFSQLPDVFGAGDRPKNSWVMTVLAYYALVHFTWLSFASHRMYWLPYRWVIT